MLRAVRLPNGVAGELRLHSMPGRDEALGDIWEDVRSEGIQVIVSLAGPDEIRTTSPLYAAAIAANAVPCAIEFFPVADFGVPDDRDAFLSFAAKIAARLATGGRMLIHCGAGVGRTGMLATCVLLALGEPLPSAEQAVSVAGAHPETAAQRQLVAWYAAERGIA